MKRLGDGFEAGPGGVRLEETADRCTFPVWPAGCTPFPDLTIHRAYEGY